MICSKCGNSIPEGVKFCPSCGEKVITYSEPAQEQPVAQPQENVQPIAPQPVPMQFNAQPVPQQFTQQAPQQASAPQPAPMQFGGQPAPQQFNAQPAPQQFNQQAPAPQPAPMQFNAQQAAPQQFAQQAAPQQFNPQPQMNPYGQPMYSQPKSSKTGLIVAISIVALIVVIGVVLLILLLPKGKGKSSGNDGTVTNATNNSNSTNIGYESVVKSYFKAISSLDTDLLYTLYPSTLAQDMSDNYGEDYVAELMEDSIESSVGYDVDLHDIKIAITYEITDSTQLSESDIQDIIDDYDYYYDEDLNVTDGYELEIDFTTKVTYQGENDTDTDSMSLMVIKVGSKWFLYFL